MVPRLSEESVDGVLLTRLLVAAVEMLEAGTGSVAVWLPHCHLTFPGSVRHLGGVLVVVSEAGVAINQSVILIATLTLLIGLRRRSQACNCLFLFFSHI